MNTDLFMLTLSAVLSFMQVMPITIGYFIYWGPKVIVSNRENLPPLPGWVTHSSAAHRNLLENLPAFAILLIVAQLSGRANEMTGLGAMLFVGARVLYAMAYIFGTPLRSVIFSAGLAGEILILMQLF